MTPPAQSNSPAFNNGLYEVLLLWGVLVMTVLIVTVLLLWTPLGDPLKRRILRMRVGPGKHSKAGQPTLRELEAHTFRFRSPQLTTPAPPYKWVLTITPPPPAHVSSANGIGVSTLTHRFSDIPRTKSGCGLGIRVQEDQAREKRNGQAISDSDQLSVDLCMSSSVGPNMHALVSESKPARVPASRPVFASEAVHVAPTGMHTVTEDGCESEKRRDKYRALLLQSDESARHELLESMSEEDRTHALSL